MEIAILFHGVTRRVVIFFIGGGEVVCRKVMYPCCLIAAEEVTVISKWLTIGKPDNYTGVVKEMRKASCGFNIRWMTHLFNNIVNEGYSPD